MNHYIFHVLWIHEFTENPVYPLESIYLFSNYFLGRRQKIKRRINNFKIQV